MNNEPPTTVRFAGIHAAALADLEELSRDYLPGWLGIELISAGPAAVCARVPIRKQLLGPFGVVHGGAMVSVADTLCGYGTVANLPAGATGFLTVELKTNFLGAPADGVLRVEATPAHVGRTTQVWDAVIGDEGSGRRLAIFRCTQLVLWPKA